ncbi:MAG: outer membrane lipoprotein carrier protein LolA [Alteromonadaceae bacterium]|jgi:outer membrane lipoprotein carrier protein|uniref:Outer-membrane lipoprotein carrier protein n=1 Tax=Paraglaciecola mesophila KMM 241 TaxID=1128912 RepID=K6YXW0_9ALTE|nr:outer membrane lipoprotein chaperone LolA [Paraglaciecola mesophila]MAD17617.1 outer membrane lipoprotein carrier protein LolA [Alteromonadaceae bacterium]GAC23007.1 outer membrane lipoprotein carrier protein [Paraglaciecola mesophila KMM 241]|tara:strand:- start:5542 stop:6204 length:663 start_codon:yes stop_codon:yes gene_type:complete
MIGIQQNMNSVKYIGNVAKLSGILLLTLGAIFSANAQQTDEDKLKARLQTLHNFSASFTQKVTDANHEVLQEATGVIKLKQPNKLYWELNPPNENILIADGNTLWNVDPFVEQVTAISQDQAVANNPLILLTQPNSDAWENFSVSYTNDTFRIDAKNPDSAVHSLVLVFDGAQLTSMSMQDSQQQISDLYFNDIQQNKTVSDKVFTFSLPDGYDLDDQRN